MTPYHYPFISISKSCLALSVMRIKSCFLSCFDVTFFVQTLVFLRTGRKTYISSSSRINKSKNILFFPLNWDLLPLSDMWMVFLNLGVMLVWSYYINKYSQAIYNYHVIMHHGGSNVLTDLLHCQLFKQKILSFGLVWNRNLISQFCILPIKMKW